MPLYLDTRGKSSVAIAVCQRCGTKVAYSDLIEDGNIQNFWVCSEECRDPLDPYRLPARAADNLVLEHPRPDIPVTDFAPTPLFGTNILDPVVMGVHVAQSPITSLNVTRPWQPNTFYRKGDTITPENVDLDTVTLPQAWLVCLRDGFSGPTSPIFPTETGVIFNEVPVPPDRTQRITMDGATRITQDGDIRITDG